MKPQFQSSRQATLLHSYTGTVMKERDGWHLLSALSFLECMSGVS